MMILVSLLKCVRLRAFHSRASWSLFKLQLLVTRIRHLDGAGVMVDEPCAVFSGIHVGYLELPFTYSSWPAIKGQYKLNAVPLNKGDVA